MTTFLLWTDLETTGLNPEMDTVLEAAWTITDTDLNMLTPFRTRMCNIQPPGRRQNAHLHRGHPLEGVNVFDVGTPGHEGDWHLLLPEVQHMHEMSGLIDALKGAAGHPVEALRMITTANDLRRLIAEDLYEVDYDRTRDTLVMAGAGVSHFDNRVYAKHMPTMFPLGGEGRIGYAYWQHDVSVAARVIGEKAWGTLKYEALDLPEIHPIYRNQTSGLSFTPGDLVGHRALDDMVRALIDGRILHRATGWTVK